MNQCTTCITIRNDIQLQRRSPRIHLVHMFKKDLLRPLALQNIVACITNHLCLFLKQSALIFKQLFVAICGVERLIRVHVIPSWNIIMLSISFFSKVFLFFL